MEHAEFEQRLGAVLVREVAGCNELLSAERLSGGASQETYRLTTNTDMGPALMCLRRAPGGVHIDDEVRIAPGLATEALLMRSAREVGVPEPDVYYVLQPADGLGDGFVMQWLEGEALGARIARAEEFASLRPRLAFQCGEYMARIHSIDLDATGLRDRLETSSPQQFV
jgi:aminoglycoside phosphotransferase (APT) family kinase protein